ncbi:MAG: hypothetical protein QNJ94_24145 [Alphaproteobacteria bacterium]|nr:hypothetical protein [Alphaproteobacteria bacterium]
MRALVVFSGDVQVRWLRLLRPGFRHCFVAVESPSGWVLYDPLAHQTVIRALPAAGTVDLAAWYRALGHRVVETRVRAAPHRPAPWAPFTCVEAVKRLLGLRGVWIWTPWQLYRALQMENRT